MTIRDTHTNIHKHTNKHRQYSNCQIYNFKATTLGKGTFQSLLFIYKYKIQNKSFDLNESFIKHVLISLQIWNTQFASSINTFYISRIIKFEYTYLILLTIVNPTNTTAKALWTSATVKIIACQHISRTVSLSNIKHFCVVFLMFIPRYYNMPKHHLSQPMKKAIIFQWRNSCKCVELSKDFKIKYLPHKASFKIAY